MSREERNTLIQIKRLDGCLTIPIVAATPIAAVVMLVIVVLANSAGQNMSGADLASILASVVTIISIVLGGRAQTRPESNRQPT
jgi:hypothetical protein